MENRQEMMRQTLFSGKQPDMDQEAREHFNMAFAFRRKYKDVKGRSPSEIYDAAIEDMRIINEAYFNNAFLMDLLLDCYDDIVRQVETENSNAESIIAKQPEQCRMAI